MHVIFEFLHINKRLPWSFCYFNYWNNRKYLVLKYVNSGKWNKTAIKTYWNKLMRMITAMLCKLERNCRYTNNRTAE